MGIRIFSRRLKATSVNSDRWRTILLNFFITDLGQRECLHSTVFMQDGVPTHIGRRVRAVLWQRSINGLTVGRVFLTNWPAHSPDPTPPDF